MPGLVFVHGIGGILHEDVALSAWRNALLDGALEAGHSRFADVLAAGAGPQVRLANYSDLFETAGAQGSRTDLNDAEAQILQELLLESIHDHIGDDHDRATAHRLEEAEQEVDHVNG